MSDGEFATGGYVRAPKPDDPPLLPRQACTFPVPKRADMLDSNMKLIFAPDRLKGWSFAMHDDGTWTMSSSYGVRYEKDVAPD